MLRAFLTLVLFVGLLVLIAFGVFWFVDNKSELIPPKEKENIASIQTLSSAVSFGDQKDVIEGNLQNETEPKDEVSENSEGESAPSDPEVKDSSEVKELSVRVLNGGAQAGAAGDTKTYLSAQGYKNVSAGDAEEYSHTGVVVYYLREDAARSLKEDLLRKFDNVQIRAAGTSEQKGADLVVILGE